MEYRQNDMQIYYIVKISTNNIIAVVLSMR